MFKSKLMIASMIVFSAVAFVGCGDGDGTTPPEPKVHTIGGTVNGLADSIVIRLKVDGEVYDELVLTEDGDFAFAEKVADEVEYEVVPHNNAENPLLTGCPNFNITNASGTANGNVTTVAINCS